MPAPTFHLIPHTHWDREWYLTRAAFQARLVPVLDAVIEQLERDSEARFVLDGQTILLEDYLAVKPDQEPRLAALVRRGALEIGPWYVLADLLVPGAASLRRNLAEGARDAARFGRRLDVLYSPDAFGHPAELPALAAEFGIRRAVVRRGVGRPGGMDRDFFRWRAPSGETLLAYHLPASGYDIAVGLGGAGAELARAWQPIRTELTGRAVTNQVAVFLGADHHAMPEEVVTLAGRLQAIEPEWEVRVSGLGEFFDAVEATNPDPPLLEGELRASDGHAWILQGVHSARSRLKRRHAEAELLLARVAEPLARAALAAGGPDRSDLIRHAWRTLLQCQFHDTLAGTTSDAVQREQEVRLASVEVLAREVGSGALADLASHDPDRAREDPAAEPARLVQWNPGSRPWASITTAELSFFRRDVLVGPVGSRTPRQGPGLRAFSLAAADEVVPVQVLGVREDQSLTAARRHYPDQDEVDRTWVAFRSPALGPGAAHLLTPRPRRLNPATEGLSARPGSLRNRWVHLEISSTGELSVEDRKAAERYAPVGGLTLASDAGDLYTASPAPGLDRPELLSVSQKVVSAGPLVGSVETRWSAGLLGVPVFTVRQLVVLHADSPVIRLRWDIDFQGSELLLRAGFPIVRAAEVVAGSALGRTRRGLAPRASGGEFEAPSPAAPAHRYVTAGTAGRRLTLVAPGFFEYEWTAEGALQFTLLRSVGALSRQDLPERPGHAAWPQPTPQALEQGLHVIRIALIAGAIDPEAAWEEVFLPPQTLQVGAPMSLG